MATIGTVGLLLGILVGASVTAEDKAPVELTQTAINLDREHNTSAEITLPWLNEVRAQRQAWEARRAAAREAYEARRRLNNPRSAAHQEAWEEDFRRRRAERLERIEKDRETFHNLVPGQFPFPWSGNIPMPNENQSGTGFASPQEPMFAPPGWDNLWYFRGF